MIEVVLKYIEEKTTITTLMSILPTPFWKGVWENRH